MYFVYVLRSNKDGKFYYGFTSDLRKRIKEHNEGLSYATRGRRPLQLVYYECFLNKNDALEREHFLKTGWGRAYVLRVLKNYLNEKPARPPKLSRR